jgi:hypothetical protein
MRSRNQHHTRADRNETQRRTDLKSDRQRANDASDQRRTAWLQEKVCAVVGQGAA